MVPMKQMVLNMSVSTAATYGVASTTMAAPFLNLNSNILMLSY